MNNTITKLSPGRIKGKLLLLFTFYKNFVNASSVITGACIYTYVMLGKTAFMTLLIFKLLTFFVIWFFTNEYVKNEFIYYYNLGISKIMLWGITFSFDLVVFLISFAIINKFL